MNENEAKRVLKVRVVNLDDWSGFYLNGKLKDEDHRLRLDECMKIIQTNTIEPASIDFKSFWADGHLDEFGNHCPDNWEELSVYEEFVD